MKKLKKIKIDIKSLLSIFVCPMFLVLAILVTSNRGGGGLDIDYGNSDRFNEKEIKAAVDHVRQNFLPDGRLTKIWYDENKSDALIELYVERGFINEAVVENTIIIFTNFIATPDTEIYTPDGDYFNYNWVLIRNGNTWEIDFHGFKDSLLGTFR